MPYILYTLGATQHIFCGLKVWTFEGYGRAHAWRPRIMRVSFE